MAVLEFGFMGFKKYRNKHICPHDLQKVDIVEYVENLKNCGSGVRDISIKRVGT